MINKVRIKFNIVTGYDELVPLIKSVYMVVKDLAERPPYIFRLREPLYLFLSEPTYFQSRGNYLFCIY